MFFEIERSKVKKRPRFHSELKTLTSVELPSLVYEFQCVHLLKPQQDFLAFQLASIGFNFYLDTWFSYIARIWRK
jgi:hypothetical protein